MLRNVQSILSADIRGSIRLSPAWRVALLQLAAGWLGLIVLFGSDWAAMAGQWWDIATYNHILFIPPIVAFLACQRAGELARIQPASWWPGLVLAAGAAFIWLLGAFSGLDFARQLGAVLLLIAAVPTILGPRIAAGLVFPLCYMLLLVPIGDELVPSLQMITASITIFLVDISGIPATIDGVFIDTPAGLFEVAEACSGVMFLIAMVAFGLLVANVCFVDWKRRLAMLAACIVVPVLANGVRAFGTIYFAQSFGIERAAGFDHIVYGWFFFAIVLSLVIAGAWPFFDRASDEPPIDGAALARSSLLGRLERFAIAPAAALAGLLLITLGAHGWARAADHIAAPLPDLIALPEVPGWKRVDYAPSVDWEPRAGGAEHRLLGRYRDGEGREVDVFFALYSRQGDGREAGGVGEGALMPGTGWAWQSPGPPIGVARSERLLADGGVRRLVATWYRTGKVTTGSNARLKLGNMADRLILRARPTAMLILSAEERDGFPAADAVHSFRRAAGPLDQWMDRVARLK